MPVVVAALFLGLMAGCTDSGEDEGGSTETQEPIPSFGPETGDDVVITSERQYIEVETIADVHGIGVDAERPYLLYIATHHGLVRLSNDSVMERVGTHSDDYMGFSIHPEQGGTFWVSGHPFRGGNMGVRYSDDGGFTWRTLALKGVDFHALAVSHADPDRLYGVYQGRMYMSADGGGNWTAPSDVPVPAMAVVPDPSDADRVYVVGSQGAALSTDAGRTWRQQWERATATMAIDPHDPERWFASFAEGLHVSDDSGATWELLDLELDNDSVGYLAFDANKAGTVYAATFRTAIHKTTDGGEDWKTIKEPR